MVIGGPLLFGQVTSYYPLLTEPGWVETSVAESFFGGNKTTAEQTNLLGIDSENRLIVPILPGFRGENPIGVINHTAGGDFDDPFDTYGKTDQTYDEIGSTLWKTLAGSIGGGSGEGAAGVIFESSTTYTNLGPGETPSDGVMLQRRKVTIGEVVATRYQQIENSTSTALDMNLRGVNVFTVDHRSVYVGTGTVDNLFSGSDPLLVTGPYSALVRVTETSLSGTTETFLVNGDSETSFGITNSGTSTITSIEWTVKGIGPVRFLFAFGEYLDDIMSHSLFNNGSNVIGAITLEELIPVDDFISEQLRASGGSLNDAADTILTTTGQEIILWPIPPQREIAPPPADPTSQVANAATQVGLTGNDLLPGSIPQKDGVENILKFAFNMDLSKSDVSTLSPQGNSGLPLAEVIKDGQLETFQLKYIRRKNSELTYTPLYSNGLESGNFVGFPGTETVTSIDNNFERVCVEAQMNLGNSKRYFAKVKIDY